MPKCPVCGTEIQAGTQYCPACGTNLQQTYGAQPSQTPSYSPGYSYQGTGLPDASKPHSHRNLILAIIGGLLIGLIIGFFIGFSLPVSVDYTTVSGTVSLSNKPGGIPVLIIFNSATNGNLSAGVASNSYQVNLPAPDTYNVSVRWYNSTMLGSPAFLNCTPSPSTFASGNQTATQNFSC